MKFLIKLLPFFALHWLIILIICVATVLRVWQLDTHGILFSDAGRDLLVAQQSLEQGTIPLLGIPSSVPRFKQGPVSIWIEMAVIFLFGVNTYAQSLTFALISIAAVIGIYEFACIYVGRKTAICAAALLATSPLAVAHGRVPYHTTPLPLALLGYLFSLLLLWQNKKQSVFLATLAFAFLFQFELAMAPLFLLVPFVLWQKKRPLTKTALLQIIGGLLLGLLPQLIFDFTHSFAQLGVFVLWIGHKILEFITFSGGGSTHITAYFSSIFLYGGRIFSTDYSIISILFLAFISYGFFQAYQLWKIKKLKPAFLITELAIILLVGSYFIHGSPSEAYFPPFLILLPLHIAFTISGLSGFAKKFALAILIIVCCFNVYSIISHNFFVDTSSSFSYGASTSEMRKMLLFINQKSSGEYSLQTLSGAENEFATYFDNYRWIALDLQISQPSNQGQIFFIESATNPAPRSVYMRRQFKNSYIYWHL